MVAEGDGRRGDLLAWKTRGNGPPLAVSVIVSIASTRLVSKPLPDRVVLAVHGQDVAPYRLTSRKKRLPAAD